MSPLRLGWEQDNQEDKFCFFMQKLFLLYKSDSFEWVPPLNEYPSPLDPFEKISNQGPLEISVASYPKGSS